MSVQTDNGIAVLSKAERMLAEVVSAQDAIDIIDMAEAARVWAQRARLGTSSINHATAIKLKAEIKLADCVDEGQRRGEIATKGQPAAVSNPRSAGITSQSVAPAATLDEIGISSQRLSESRKIRDAFTPDAIDEIVESANLQDKEIARKEFVQQRAHVSYNGGENEWYTPPEFIAAARATFLADVYDDDAENSIDLDPATSDLAQSHVRAARFYTKEDDGLAQEWSGCVWMNPPYAQPLIGQFVDKLLAEYHAGNVTAAIVLVNNGTDTKWGQKLLEAAAAVCFPSGRIRFIDKEGRASGAPLQGQMIVYLAPDLSHEDWRPHDAERGLPWSWIESSAFGEQFGQFGTVLHGR